MLIGTIFFFFALCFVSCIGAQKECLVNNDCYDLIDFSQRTPRTVYCIGGTCQNKTCSVGQVGNCEFSPYQGVCSYSTCLATSTDVFCRLTDCRTSNTHFCDPANNQCSIRDPQQTDPPAPCNTNFNCISVAYETGQPLYFCVDGTCQSKACSTGCEVSPYLDNCIFSACRNSDTACQMYRCDLTEEDPIYSCSSSSPDTCVPRVTSSPPEGKNKNGIGWFIIGGAIAIILLSAIICLCATCAQAACKTPCREKKISVC